MTKQQGKRAETEHIGTHEAAGLLGISERMVQMRLHDGKLQGRKEGKRWLVSAESVRGAQRKLPAGDEAFREDFAKASRNESETAQSQVLNPAAETRRRVLEGAARIEKLGAYSCPAPESAPSRETRSVRERSYGCGPPTVAARRCARRPQRSATSRLE